MQSKALQHFKNWDAPAPVVQKEIRPPGRPKFNQPSKYKFKELTNVHQSWYNTSSTLENLEVNSTYTHILEE